MNDFETNQFRCFFNLLHVRTFTILIGGWHLALNVACLSLLVFISKNPAAVQMEENDDDIDSILLPTPVSVGSQSNYHNSRDHSISYADTDMGGFVCICMVIIIFLLIYGTIKERPSHLLPFFFLQLCDFAITSLSAAGYLCYLKTIRTLIDETNRLPWKEDIRKIDSRTLGVLVLIVFVFMILLKAYCIGVVWRCYKYLTIRQNATLLSFIIQDPSINQEANLNYNSLLPNYDEAVNMKIAPPSYSAAMSLQPQSPSPLTSPPSPSPTPENQQQQQQQQPPSYQESV